MQTHSTYEILLTCSGITLALLEFFDLSKNLEELLDKFRTEVLNKVFEYTIATAMYNFLVTLMYLDNIFEFLGSSIKKVLSNYIEYDIYKELLDYDNPITVFKILRKLLTSDIPLFKRLTFFIISIQSIIMSIFAFLVAAGMIVSLMTLPLHELDKSIIFLIFIFSIFCLYVMAPLILVGTTLIIIGVVFLTFLVSTLSRALYLTMWILDKPRKGTVASIGLIIAILPIFL